ncbi:MAG: hypothetical protein RLZZ297_1405 [Chloroflexota bacterium]
MHRSAVAEARAYDSWNEYDAALRRAIAPLTLDQLQQRPLPHMRTVGDLAAHIVYGRALHLTHTLGDAAHAVSPFLAWGSPQQQPLTAALIVDGFAVTWDVIATTLLQGDPTTDLDDETHQRIQTIWGLLDHDLPHAGELSVLLGAIGLPGVEI